MIHSPITVSDSTYKHLLSFIRLEKSKYGRCWIWTGSIRKGYGLFRAGLKVQTAHRVSYVVFNYTQIPFNYDVHHKCKNKLCINPIHLELIDKSDHGKLHKKSKTHCIHGHELTPDNLYYTKSPNGNSRRQCKTCTLTRRYTN